MEMIIAGEKVNSSDQRFIAVCNPATGQEIDRVPRATIADTQRALQYAADNKGPWANTPIRQRADILIKAADQIAAERDTLAKILTMETGKVFWQAQLEVDSAIGLFKGYAEKAKHLYDSLLPSETDLITVKYEPLGVVACITPFNFPIELYAHKVAPALTAGNSVIVKPASGTPMSAIYLTDLLIRAGVPCGSLQVITGSGNEIGKYIAQSPLVNAISLTGSTEVGAEIMEHASKNITRTFMELGGNDALIILDDADIEKAVDGAVKCRVYCAGQVCSASKRFLVHNAVREEFTSRLLDALEHVTVGDPFDPNTVMGSLASRQGAKEVEAQVKKTVSQGAACILGGTCGENAFFPPTVLENVTRDMDIARDMEVFGPVFPIIGFDTDEEAISIANQSSYGLSGGIFTQNISRGYQMAEKLDTGSVTINPPYVYRTFDLPFGGHKKSGIGNEGIFSTLQEMMQIKTITITGIK